MLGTGAGQDAIASQIWPTSKSALYSPKMRAALLPNQRLQLTPLRGPKIVAILKVDFGSTVIPI